MKVETWKKNIKIAFAIVIALIFSITRIFVSSTSIKKEYEFENIFSGVVDDDNYLYFVKEDGLLEMHERSINIEGYKKMARVGIAMFYDEAENLWKNKYYEKGNGKKKAELFSGGNVYDTISIDNYLEELKNKVVMSNYNSKEYIYLDNEIHDGIIKNYIEEKDKKLVITQIWLRYNKELGQFSEVCVDAWFLKK